MCVFCVHTHRSDVCVRIFIYAHYNAHIGFDAHICTHRHRIEKGEGCNRWSGNKDFIGTYTMIS